MGKVLAWLAKQSAAGAVQMIGGTLLLAGAAAIVAILLSIPQGLGVAIVIAVAGLALLALGTFWKWRHSDAQPTEKGQTTLQSIRGHNFEHKTVVLDGIRYGACSFRDCTFQWFGGPFKIDADCKLEGQQNFETTVRPAVEAVSLLKYLGLLGNAEWAATWSDDLPIHIVAIELPKPPAR